MQQLSRVSQQRSVACSRRSRHAQYVPLRATVEGATGANVTQERRKQLLSALDAACLNMAKAPPSQKMEYSVDVVAAWKAITEAGAAPKWGSAMSETLRRRSVMIGELRQVGIKKPDQIAVPSVRNDAAFLFSVVMATSLGAVVAGAVLPGQLGFWDPHAAEPQQSALASVTKAASARRV